MAQEEFKYIVRIGGTDLDGNKKIPYGLSKIKGIGLPTGGVICGLAGVDPNKKIGYLTDEEATKLEETIENFQNQKVPSWLFNRRRDFISGRDIHVIGSDLVISIRNDINRMKKIRCYKGVRHELGLPVRGQRTRTSFRTGMTVGVSREKAKASAAQAEKEAKKAEEAKAAPKPKQEEVKQTKEVKKTERVVKG